MKELKGDWRDLFKGFKIALHLSKMFLAFVGLALTGLLIYASVMVSTWIKPGAVLSPASWTPHEMWNALLRSWHVIFQGHWMAWITYSVIFGGLLLGVWSLIGGAIARIAAFEIARDGERIETKRALAFARKKFWALFGSFLLCAGFFLFFFLCNALGGALGKLFDWAFIGGPLVALFLPLALLSGFIMLLILIAGSVGWPLFFPAVAAEGTDSFDAVSRGFSYVYSCPWHYAWYQFVSAVYGWVCVTFVVMFTVAMCYLGTWAGAKGWQTMAFWHSSDDNQDPHFNEKGDPHLLEVNERAWTNFLSNAPQHSQLGSYAWDPRGIAASPHPYGRIMFLANYSISVRPKHGWFKERGAGRVGPNLGYYRSATTDLGGGVTVEEYFPGPGDPPSTWDTAHKVSYWILTIWFLLAMGMAWGYAVSYFISQQTMIYYLLRKKVDGIEMNEVYEEPEEEEPFPEAFKPGEEKKPEEPPATPPPPSQRPPPAEKK